MYAAVGRAGAGDRRSIHRQASSSTPANAAAVVPATRRLRARLRRRFITRIPASNCPLLAADLLPRALGGVHEFGLQADELQVFLGGQLLVAQDPFLRDLDLSR